MRYLCYLLHSLDIFLFSSMYIIIISILLIFFLLFKIEIINYCRYSIYDINIIRIHMYFVCKIHYEALLIICTANKNKTRRYVWFRLCIKILHIIRCFGKNVLCNPLLSIKKKIYIITCNIPFNNSDDIFSRINWWGNMIYVYCCCEVSAIVCYGSGRIWVSFGRIRVNSTRIRNPDRNPHLFRLVGFEKKWE